MPSATPAPSPGGSPQAASIGPAALTLDPGAETPRASHIASVLLGVMRSHPESQELLVLVYSLLTIVCSQGASACPPAAAAGARAGQCGGREQGTVRGHTGTTGVH